MGFFRPVQHNGHVKRGRLENTPPEWEIKDDSHDKTVLRKYY